MGRTSYFQFHGIWETLDRIAEGVIMKTNLAKSIAPIIIAGCPRSGTSLLRTKPLVSSEKCVNDSRLNIVETLLGKMARTFLRHIGVQSKNDLRQRVLKGIAEINEMPLVHRSKVFEAPAQTDSF